MSIRDENLREFINQMRNELSHIKEIKDYNQVYSYVLKRAIRHSLFENFNIDDIFYIANRTTNSIKSDSSILKPYVDDDSISEIMVNGYNNIFVEKNGQIVKVEEEFFDTNELEEVIRRIASRIHREINELNPIVDARLEDGSRVNAVYKNIALDGPILTIRKFPQKNVSMCQLIEWQTITNEAAEYVKYLLDKGYNFFISGGTSSGKTTFLNALASMSNPKERIIVIEDSAELKIDNIPNLVRMECKTANATGQGEISIDKLIKTSLRMRPDKIIIGEIRDGKALLNMLNGLNTGHSGLCTGHGNSVEGMIKRMEAMYMQEAEFPIEAIDSQIAEGVNIIIHMIRREDYSRKVMEISQLYIDENNRIAVNILFSFDGVKLIRTKNKLIKKQVY